MTNRIFIPLSTVLTLATLSLFFLAATTPAGAHQTGAGDSEYSKPVDHEDFNEHGPGKHFERLAAVLDLTVEQRAQIEQIVANEQTGNAAIRAQLREHRARLRALTESAVFDEEAIRAVAAEKAQQRIELMVARARTRHAINALLTPEQRELAQKLRPLLKGGGEKGRRGPEPGPIYEQE